MLLENSSAMWLHSLSSPVCDVYCVLMFITSVKHKRCAPWWWSFWTETCRSIL